MNNTVHHLIITLQLYFLNQTKQHSIFPTQIKFEDKIADQSKILGARINKIAENFNASNYFLHKELYRKRQWTLCEGSINFTTASKIYPSDPLSVHQEPQCSKISISQPTYTNLGHKLQSSKIFLEGFPNFKMITNSRYFRWY